MLSLFIITVISLCLHILNQIIDCFSSDSNGYQQILQYYEDIISPGLLKLMSESCIWKWICIYFSERQYSFYNPWNEQNIAGYVCFIDIIKEIKYILSERAQTKKARPRCYFHIKILSFIEHPCKPCFMQSCKIPKGWDNIAIIKLQWVTTEEQYTKDCYSLFCRNVINMDSNRYQKFFLL